MCFYISICFFYLLLTIPLRYILGVSGAHPELENLYLMLDQQFHPIPPDTTCPQSVQIFEEHKQVNYWFFILLHFCQVLL